jgi:hypothetical protein
MAARDIVVLPRDDAEAEKKLREKPVEAEIGSSLPLASSFSAFVRLPLLISRHVRK